MGHVSPRPRPLRLGLDAEPALGASQHGVSGSQPALAEVRAVPAAPGAFLGQGCWSGCSSPARSLLLPVGTEPRGPHCGEEGGGAPGAQRPPQSWDGLSKWGQDREWMLSVGAPRKEGGSWQGVGAGD